jgi:hypothetical protein
MTYDKHSLIGQLIERNSIEDKKETAADPVGENKYINVIELLTGIIKDLEKRIESLRKL